MKTNDAFLVAIPETEENRQPLFQSFWYSGCDLLPSEISSGSRSHEINGVFFARNLAVVFKTSFKYELEVVAETNHPWHVANFEHRLNKTSIKKCI